MIEVQSRKRRWPLDDEGVALIATLILGMIAISFTLTMVYLTREGSRMVGIEGRYQNALQAAKGGVEVAIDYIRNCSPDNDTPVYAASVSGRLDCTCSIGPTDNETYYPCDNSHSSFVSLIGEYRVAVSVQVDTIEGRCENAPTDNTKRRAVSLCKITSTATNVDSHKRDCGAVDVLYKMVVENCSN